MYLRQLLPSEVMPISCRACRCGTSARQAPRMAPAAWRSIGSQMALRPYRPPDHRIIIRSGAMRSGGMRWENATVDTASFGTPSGKGQFSTVELPPEQVPKGKVLLSTRRGKQFNSVVYDQTDPLNGARRDDVLMAAEDASRLALRAGDAVVLRNERGSFRGRVKIDRIKPGSLQVHWPEGNVLIASEQLDESGVPDYNAVVEVSRK